MTKPLEALTAEMARESANILIIVAARLVRRECLTPLHALSDLNQKTISTRALRDAIDRVEESLVREAGKIRDGHDRLAKKLKETEVALEQSQSASRTLESLGYTDNGGQFWKPPIGPQPNFSLMDSYRQRIAELESQNLTTSNALLDAGKRIAELEDSHSQVIQARDHYKSLVSASQLAVKLPERYDLTGETDGNCNLNDAYMAIDKDGIYFRCADVIESLRAAGITVQGDE